MVAGSVVFYGPITWRTCGGPHRALSRELKLNMGLSTYIMEREMVENALLAADNVFATECSHCDGSDISYRCYDCVMGANLFGPGEWRHEFFIEIHEMVDSMLNDCDSRICSSPKVAIALLTDLQHRILTYKTLLDCPRASTHKTTALATLIELIGNTIKNIPDVSVAVWQASWRA